MAPAQAGTQEPNTAQYRAITRFSLHGLSAQKLLKYGSNTHFTKEVSVMSDAMPDRLSVNPNSEFYNEALLERGVGVRFKGVEKTNVEEYCVSEGWVRVAVGKTVDRRGNALTMKLNGPVEVWLKD